MQLLYAATSSTIKISLFLFVKTIAKKGFVVTQRVLNGAILVVVLQMLAFLCITALSCRPVEAFWMQTSYSWAKSHDFQCWNVTNTLIALVATQVTIDIVLCVCVLWTVHSPAWVGSGTTRLPILNTSLAIAFIIAGCVRTYDNLDHLRSDTDFICT